MLQLEGIRYLVFVMNITCSNLNVQHKDKFYDFQCFQLSSRRSEMSPGTDNRGRMNRRGSMKDSETNNNQHIDFKPNGGVTFRPNKTSDVQVRILNQL